MVDFLPLVHTERVEVQHNAKHGKISIVCTVLLSGAAASAYCVNTFLGNSCFHLLNCVTQTLRYVTRCIMRPVWTRGQWCCCCCTVCEHTPWQQLFPFVVLRHADVTLRHALCVDERLSREREDLGEVIYESENVSSKSSCCCFDSSTGCKCCWPQAVQNSSSQHARSLVT